MILSILLLLLGVCGPISILSVRLLLLWWLHYYQRCIFFGCGFKRT